MLLLKVRTLAKLAEIPSLVSSATSLAWAIVSSTSAIHSMYPRSKRSLIPLLQFVFKKPKKKPLLKSFATSRSQSARTILLLLALLPTGGQFRGLGTWINNSPTADDVAAVPAPFKTPTGNVLDDGTKELTESRFNSMLTSIFEETGEQGDHVLVAGTTARNEIIDGFTRVHHAATLADGFNTGNSTTFNQGDGTEVNYNVEIFQGPYGIVKIISANPKCLPDQKRAYLLDPSLLGYAEAMSMGSTMLEDQGGGPRGYIDAMGTLLCKGPNGLGKITNFAV